MLTQDEEKFLATIPEDKLIEIRPYDPEIKRTAHQLISEVRDLIPEADIHFMGASALELAGQNDIDLYLFSNPDQIAIFRDKLIPLFGIPSLDKSFVEWDFLRDGFNVEFYITDPNTESMQRQIKVFNLLSLNEELREEFPDIVLDVVGLNSSPLVASLANQNLRLHGRVDNTNGFYDNARVFIAPTQFAAGIPLKLLKLLQKEFL